MRLAAIPRFAPAGQGRDEICAGAPSAPHWVTSSDSAGHRVLNDVEERCGPLIFARVYGKLDSKVERLTTGGRRGIVGLDRRADLRVNLE
jgi:hypothetical protein